jgi:pimeloyl-ACP methyl ester carboxylesterase
MSAPIGRPDTRFVETPKGFVGYQVYGRAEPDIVFITNWMTNVDLYWEELSAIRYLDRLGEMGRVFLIDKRGSGVSDHSARGYIDPIEDTVDDVLAVLDANGSSEAVLIGDTEGGMLACILAATYPERFPTLILVNSYARMTRADDYPIGAPPHVVDAFSAGWKASFVDADTDLPRRAQPDPRFRAWHPWFQRQAMAPSVARKAGVDRRDDIRIRPRYRPTRSWCTAGLPDFTASASIPPRSPAHAPKSRGADTLPFHAGDSGPTLDAIEAFITGQEQGPIACWPRSCSATFRSTTLASEAGDDRWLDARTEHNRIVRLQLERFRGKEVSFTGDGFVATFDGPLRAIQCAQVMVSEVKRIGLDIRVGIHTGEIEMRDGDVGGLALHIGARVMDAAPSGRIMASRTVKDLVIGSNMDFVSCGPFELKGVPGSWDLFEVRGSPV